MFSFPSLQKKFGQSVSHFLQLSGQQHRGSRKTTDLFNIYSDAILSDLEYLTEFINGRDHFSGIRYAVDTVLMETERKLGKVTNIRQINGLSMD